MVWDHLTLVQIQAGPPTFLQYAKTIEYQRNFLIASISNSETATDNASCYQTILLPLFRHLLELFPRQKYLLHTYR